MEVVVLGADDIVEFSTVTGFTAGSAVDEGAVLRYLHENEEATVIRPREPREDDSAAGAPAAEPLFLVRLPPRPTEQRTLLRIFRSRTIESLIYPVLVLLLFASGVSFWIVRRFNRSVRSLEAATRKVADGDLDFGLPVHGDDEVSSLTRSFERMRTALREEFARRARFIMGVSHDLRTPLALIQGYVEAVTDGLADDPDTRRKYLAIVQDKTRALDAMVTDLIEFARMDTGEWKTTTGPCASPSSCGPSPSGTSRTRQCSTAPSNTRSSCPRISRCPWTRSSRAGRSRTSSAMRSATRARAAPSSCGRRSRAGCR